MPVSLLSAQTQTISSRGLFTLECSFGALQYSKRHQPVVCVSVFRSVEYEMLRPIKFLQQLDFLLEGVLGILSNIKMGIN